ncbi:MAG: hypothetical protein GXO79_00895 [Chlorobi bacterium]|nr:hypothetical protein [Chlorobiota bacterium]
MINLRKILLYKFSLIRIARYFTKINNKGLIDRLRQNIYTLNSNSNNLTPEWKNFKTTIREKILTNNPNKFLSWQVITETMFYANPKQLTFLKEHKDWQKINKVIKHKTWMFGFPKPYYYFPLTSANIINHTYSLYKLLSKFKKTINDFSVIFEFGGGYGNLCSLVYKFGYKGKYIILDIQEFSFLQEFYLNNILKNKKIEIGSISGNADISLIYDYHNIPDDIDLLIALWSLSETPINIRENIISRTEKCNCFFIGSQNKFSGIDNNDFFEKFSLKKKKLNWKKERISFNNSFYLYGY